ncbi:hypothetical protein Tsubulata_017198, partial [Turnera subulata]
MANQLVPQKLQEKLMSHLGGLFGEKSSLLTLIIKEMNGLSTNEIYQASEVYLSTRITPPISQLKVSKDPGETEFSVSISRGQKIVDTFEGIHFVWEFIATETQQAVIDIEGFNQSSEKKEHRSVMLSFHKQHKDKVFKNYLPHVMERSKAIKNANRVIKLYSLGDYNGVNLNHPSTFDTLAMDPVLKKELMDDLDRFVERKDFYRRIGKPWKRGYLLYGPPGTGKSSLVAAMANYLKFDIYDMELASLRSNSELRRLLSATSNRSILVIEDIDCSIQLQDRQIGDYDLGDNKLTLSGLLNFVDGLWSSYGDEMIFVFTTNYKDKLDPALLRPGRMDMHIHMSYCTPAGFKILASNYLNTRDHSLFAEIEELIQQVEVTPAEVAEELIKTHDVDAALKGLTELLLRKKQTKSEKSSVEEEIKVDETNIEGVKDQETNDVGKQEMEKKCQRKRAKKNRKNAGRRTMANQLVPQKLQDKLMSHLGNLFGEKKSSLLTLIINEMNGLSTNEIYQASEVYLSTRITPSISQLKVSKDPGETEFSVSISRGQKIVDTFEGIQFVWEFIATETQQAVIDIEGFNQSSEKKEHRSVMLGFHKQHKDKVFKNYLPHVMERSKAIKNANRVIKLYSLGDYNGVNLNHPSTFDTLAMDPILKKELMDDLDRFVERKDFYRRIGKAWKRGYLLYGPPGTGKSSLVAAMANHLKFDIYDMELASLRSNSELRRLLSATSNRSILVIEDIDCSIQLQNRQYGDYDLGDNKLTLSGLLNFVDGLWSSYGDEMIFVFTTNYKDKLDPALLRPGRMDMHIHMSYCTPAGFKILASNYLNIQNHSLFAKIEELIEQVEVTPAEVAEELIKTHDVDAALQGLTELLLRKKQTKSEKSSVEEEIKVDETNIEEVKDQETNDVEKQEMEKKCQRKRAKKNRKNAGR